MGKQLISENDNSKQVARETCGGVIMKVIAMKLEITQLRCENIVTYNISYKVSRKLARFDEPQEYTVHCIFISGECNVLIAMCSLVLQ